MARTAPWVKFTAPWLKTFAVHTPKTNPMSKYLFTRFWRKLKDLRKSLGNGSKIGDKAGAGVYGKTTRTKLSFALGSYASVFQAEIYAILACGMEILKTAPKRRTIQICTDSQAALMAIESSKVKSRLVLDCKKILNDLASCNRVILTWVPGHSGVLGNEEADRLARVGSIGYPIGPEPILGVPYSMGVSTMKELLNKEFEKSWQEAPVWHNVQSDAAEEVNDFAGVSEISGLAVAEEQQLVAEVEYLGGWLMERYNDSFSFRNCVTLQRRHQAVRCVRI
ncbi:hypothetical protein NQ318_021908 [Aromia moschata]|uniref:RNase H type-1 domain-containing protein n=1 Tax=Aromia moschata TaxID=1265417 RepID=A0AAV8Z7D7_9CUCU|nr:hypothetical protein NQ318_021908 [Aromia moschata]